MLRWEKLRHFPQPVRTLTKINLADLKKSARILDPQDSGTFFRSSKLYMLVLSKTSEASQHSSTSVRIPE
jgi:hypothetical protein